MRATTAKRNFKEGEKVLLADQSKKKGLKPRFKGPFIVESITPHGNVKLKDDKHSHHPKNLKKLVEGTSHIFQKSIIDKINASIVLLLFSFLSS